MDQTIGFAQVDSDLVIEIARLSVCDDDHLERVGRTGLIAGPTCNVSWIAARIAERNHHGKLRYSLLTARYDFGLFH
jgi:hypothetical protein